MIKTQQYHIAIWYITLYLTFYQEVSGVVAIIPKPDEERINRVNKQDASGSLVVTNEIATEIWPNQ